MMDGSLLVQLGLRFWPLRYFLVAHRFRRASLALVLLLFLAPWLPAPCLRAEADFPARSLALPAGPPLVSVAIDPRLGRAFVADASGAVWTLDERSGRLLEVTDAGTTETGAPSGAMAVDDLRHRIYLPTLTGNLALLDDRSGVFASPWTLGSAFALALDGVAHRVLVPQSEQRALVALDARSRRVVATVALAAPPGVLAVDPSARRVYVAAAAAPRLDVLDADSLRSLATVALPGPADALAVDSSTHRVYAADPAGGTVTVVDGRSGAVLATIHLGAAPVALALNAETGDLFVADADNLVVVDTRRDAIVARIPVAAQPVAVAVDPRSGLVYVAGSPTGAASALPGNRTVTVFRDDRRSPTLLAALVAGLSPHRGRSDHSP